MRENRQKFTVFAHNIFGFDFYFAVKGVRLSVWGKKDFTMGEI